MAERLTLALALAGATAVGGSRGQQGAAQPRLTPVEVAVQAAYHREFAEVVARPAILNNASGNQCEEPRLTTTAYFRTSASSARLVYLITTPNGRAVIRKSRVASVVIPEGTFRVLVVMVRHQATAEGADLIHWAQAQAKINRDHAAFASSRGLATPIVSFANTNLVLDASDIDDPRSRSSVVAAAEQRGLDTASFQFIVSINLDPVRSEGGFAGAAGFVYMGNYGRWSRPLAAGEWVNLANAVYHHEVAHLWGWPGTHDWAPRCGSAPADSPFIVPPILFGWEDVDGDGVPEILDATPYGRLE